MFDVLENWLDTVDQVIDGSAELVPTTTAHKSQPREAKRGTSLVDVIKGFLGLDSWTFYVDFNGDWTGAQIESLLKRHGVRISNRMAPLPFVTVDDLFFDVKLSQAEWAEYVMLKADVPLKYGLYSSKNRRRFPDAVERAAAYNNQ